APVEIRPGLAGIAGDAHRRADLPIDEIDAGDRSLPMARPHCRAMERELEAVSDELPDERHVFRILQRLGGEELSAAFGTVERPGSLRGPESQRPQQRVDRPYIVDSRVVRIIEDREGESLALGKLQCRSG